MMANKGGKGFKAGFKKEAKNDSVKPSMAGNQEKVAGKKTGKFANSFMHGGVVQNMPASGGEMHGDPAKVGFNHKGKVPYCGEGGSMAKSEPMYSAMDKDGDKD